MQGLSLGQSIWRGGAHPCQIEVIHLTSLIFPGAFKGFLKSQVRGPASYPSH